MVENDYLCSGKTGEGVLESCDHERKILYINI